MNNPGRNPRLEPHPSQLIDRSRPVAFEFDGRSIEGYEGDTVASALHAAGIATLSRSFKYHRSRGLFCAAGRCPNCLMTVDGVPNVRACTQQVHSGMNVIHQNAWPSVKYDFLSVLDRMGWLMPVGFYYKIFYSSRLFWRIMQPIIRRLSGLGKLEVDRVPDNRYRHRNRHADVAVVGGGPAGLAAALAAAGAGADVTLVDDQASLGGSLRFDAESYRDIDGVPESAGHEIASRLAEDVRRSANIHVLSDSTAFGLYQDNLIGVSSDEHLVKIRAKRVIVAAGSREAPLVFEGNDLPGVMLATGIRRLIRLYGVKPGETAVVATVNDEGYRAALDLLDAGVRIAAVVDVRREFRHGLEAAEALKARGILILPAHAVVRSQGRKRVAGAVVAPVEDGGSTGGQRRFTCDVICVSGGFEPENALLLQSGGRFSFDEVLGEAVPDGLPQAVSAAGEVTGIHELRAAMLQGKLAGWESAAGLGLASSTSETDMDATRRELEDVVGRYRNDVRAAPYTEAAGEGKRRFVCYCEDMTSRDIRDAIDEGFADIQTLKRYSTITQGPCQGKMCMKSFVSICARHTGRSIGETGVPTARPPVLPVPLGALAGPSHLPVKRSPMHRRHLELGAHMVDLGPWRRAYSYASPQEESLAVRQRVGIIDVSTLGKLDVAGRDAAALLDKVYTQRISNLGIGRIRYGILCADNGTIMDDGTVTRLAGDHFFVTTTTGNVDLIEEWFKWWTAGTGSCVHVTNMTSAFAAINVAGPRARETLARLTDLDLSSGAFPYMRSARGDVAGVPAILLRIGFVGETGWEIHFAAEYGEHVWDALMEAGKEFGIAPFGLEAQRILRLEKKHIIVGQDTDADSSPLDSDMSWAVRFDKDDFIGRGGLLGIKERGLRNRLVGFVVRDGVVPDDGDPVVAGQVPVGRVTSARVSPTLGKGIGLAWVPVEMAEEGKEIRIRVDGDHVTAEVTLQPLYDPEGVRLRE